MPFIETKIDTFKVKDCWLQ